MKPRRDPLVGALTTAVVIVLIGFTAIALGKRITAEQAQVHDQIPALVSGGMVGLALVIAGCALGYVQVSRALAARERIDSEAVLDGLSDANTVAVQARAVPAAEPVTEAVPVVRTPRARRATAPAATPPPA